MMKTTVLIGFLITFIYGMDNMNNSLHLPTLISDNMVLQQNSVVSLWGWAPPLEKVQIKPSWLPKTLQTAANSDGRWEIKIKTLQGAIDKTYTITFSCRQHTIQVSNIVFGEVWLASGQSNMEMPLAGWGKDEPVDNSEFEIANASLLPLRMFTVKQAISSTPKEDCQGRWEISNSTTAKKFSATAYFFAKYLYKKLKVPIGIIHSSWGGTPIEAWTSLAFLKKTSVNKNIEDKLKVAREQLQTLQHWLNKQKKITLDLSNPNRWIEPINTNDDVYLSNAFDNTLWKKINMPGLWQLPIRKDFEGIVWLKKEFVIPENLNLNDLTLYLAKIDEMDETFINGTKIGEHLSINFWTTERLYAVPPHLLRHGKNTIHIKIYNFAGAGGIYGDNFIGITRNGQKLIDFSGKWYYLPAALWFNSILYVFTEPMNYVTMPPMPQYVFDQHTPSLLYNAMIAPLIPFTIKGIIWYQGESNVENAKDYQELFPTLIQNWRTDWQLGSLPFYYVQIAPFRYNEDNPTLAAELRWAQFVTLHKLPNLGMVVTTDIGNVNNIHPSNKKEVGRRLSLWALNKVYGFTSVECSGPLFKNCEFHGQKAIINFDHIDGGLICKGDSLTYFELADKDGTFFPAHAQIVENKVIVQCKKTPQPFHVRFGWHDEAQPNLFNKVGLPASPFKY